MNTSKMGFASMPIEKRREIASMGGKAVPPDRRSFSRNAQLAAEAGRKGGKVSRGGGRRPRATPVS